MKGSLDPNSTCSMVVATACSSSGRRRPSARSSPSSQRSELTVPRRRSVREATRRRPLDFTSPAVAVVARILPSYGGIWYDCCSFDTLEGAFATTLALPPPHHECSEPGQDGPGRGSKRRLVDRRRPRARGGLTCLR